MINPFETGQLGVDANGRIINRAGQPISIERQGAIAAIPEAESIPALNITTDRQDVAALVEQLTETNQMLQERIQVIQNTLNELLACSTKAGVLSAK